MKRTLFYSMRAKEGSVTAWDSPLGISVLGGSRIMLLCASSQMNLKVVQELILGWQIYFSGK